MINHIRTLLLNKESYANRALPGEEYVPPTFKPRYEPSAVRKFRQVVFGYDPDRYMLNYRLYQFMALLHSSELVDYITAIDHRLTYNPQRNAFPDDLFGISSVPLGDTTGSLDVFGIYTANEIRGRLYEAWQVASSLVVETIAGCDAYLVAEPKPTAEVDALLYGPTEARYSTDAVLANDATQATVTATTDSRLLETQRREYGADAWLVSPDPTRLQATVLKLTDPNASHIALCGRGTAVRSDPVSLPGTDLQFTFTGGPYSSWFVDALARPQQDLSQLSETLQATLTVEDEAAIFGASPQSVMATFRNLWRDHDVLAYKLGGLLLGIAYCLDSQPTVS